MPRTLSADALNQKDKGQNRPIELYRIFLDEQTLYFAMYPVDVDFFDEDGNPVTYHAAALQRNPINTSVDAKVDQCRVSIDNVTKEMSAYIANTEFVGRRMQILKVFLDADRDIQSLTVIGRPAYSQHVDDVEGAGLEYAENAIIIFDGIMDAPQVNEYQMSVAVVSKLDKLDRKLPARTFQVQCPWVFGDSDTCGVSPPTLTGSIDSIDYLTINDNAITESAGYWRHGEITVGKETRVVTESGDGYVKIEFPFSASVEAGDSYELVAGCDKSFDGGHGCAFWDNRQYYGGFLRIPRIKNVRRVT